jgi:hypothetical protein
MATMSNEAVYDVSTGKTEIVVIAEVAVTAEALASYKQHKIESISEICESEIIAGFPSNALGVTHQYSFDTDDQANISGIMIAINSNLCPPTRLWRTIDAGPFQHTIAQLQQLFVDGMIHKGNIMDKKGSLKDRINDVATDTTEKVDAIVW